MGTLGFSPIVVTVGAIGYCDDGGPLGIVMTVGAIGYCNDSGGGGGGGGGGGHWVL